MRKLLTSLKFLCWVFLVATFYFMAWNWDNFRWFGMCCHNDHFYREIKSFNLLLSWLTWPIPPPPPSNVALVTLGFQTDSKFGNLKQWHINETANRLFCLAIRYLNKRNSVAFGMDRFFPNPSSTHLPSGSWPDHYFGLELCSSYLQLATWVVHQAGFSQIPFSVCSKTLIPLVLTNPLTSARLRLWSWDRPHKHFLLQRTAVLKAPHES